MRIADVRPHVFEAKLSQPFAWSFNMSSRPGEFHPQALPKPCMTLSSHTAPDVQPLP